MSGTVAARVVAPAPVPPRTATTAWILMRAARNLRTLGWVGVVSDDETCQARFLATVDGVFFVAALHLAIDQIGVTHEDIAVALNAIGFSDSTDAHEWSNTSGRTVDDLLARLEGDARRPARDGTRWIRIDGEVFPFSDVARANQDDPDLADAIAALAIGEVLFVGGGAAHEAEVVRVPTPREAPRG